MPSKKYNKIVTIRMTEEEKKNIDEIAEISGLSLSEVVRRKYNNLTIKSKIDMVLVNELRRQGGLLKNNFNTLRELHTDKTAINNTLKQQEELFFEMKKLIATIATSYDS